MSIVSVSELENLYNKFNSKKSISLVVGNNEDKFEFEVKHRLDKNDVTTFVASVCDGVLNIENGSYHPELRDYYMRVSVLKAYTNIVLPQSDKCWELVYGTPVFAMITGHDRRPVVFDGRDYDDNMVIDVEQYEQIIAAIDQRITYSIFKTA